MPECHHGGASQTMVAELALALLRLSADLMDVSGV